MATSFKHFAETTTVLALISEIKQRHKNGYEALINDICTQIEVYFYGQFEAKSKTGGRSRFQTTDSFAVQPRFLIGLSGGIDSSVATLLACRAVGRDCVLPITMPARPDDSQCLQHAALIRHQLGYDDLQTPEALPFEINIQPIIQAHIEVMDKLELSQTHLGGTYVSQNHEQKMRSGNFSSRVRTAVLYDFARSIRGRVLGTVNRTEYCQGYNAKYGTPISYDFGVLNALYKIDIYEIAKQLGVPQAIIDAAPTTGYFEGQTHEGELGASIEEQDIFAYLLFEKQLSIAEIVENYGANEIFVRLMHYRFEVCDHKRALNWQQPNATLNYLMQMK